MKNLLLLLGLTLSLNTFGQDINSYSYVVVPEKYTFLKESDQYQLNTLTKFLFGKYGFRAFIEGEEDYMELNPDRCEGLYADVLNDSGMFRTRLSLVLKDCKNRQVFISQEGMSREKDYNKAYQEALRKAFESVEALNYSGNQVIVSGTPDLNIKTEVREKPFEVQTIAEGKNEKKTDNTPVQNQRKDLPVNEVIPSADGPVSMNFVRDGRSYLLQKSNSGFNLFHQGTTEPFATLIRSSAGNSFMYNSMTSKGVACIDNNGNLIIEILKEDGNSLETIVYRAADQ